MSEINSLELETLMSSTDPYASEISNRWSELASMWQTVEGRIAETEKFVFATTVQDTSNVQGEYNHTTHIPKITEIYDRLKANYVAGLVGREDFFEFHGEDQASVMKERRDKIESYLRTKHRLRNTISKIQEAIDDWIFGNCFAEVVYVNEYHDDPKTGERHVVYQGPDIKIIDFSDIRFNILATDFRSTPKIIRSHKTFGGLERDIEQLPTAQAEEAKKVLNKVKSLRSHYTKAPQDIKDRYDSMACDGFGTWGTYMKSGVIEVLTFYGDIYNQETGEFLKNHKLTIVDRKWTITNEPINTWDGKPLILHAGWRKRRDNILGMGPLENITGMQYRINHLENSRADAFDKMLEPDLVLRGDVEIEDGPNGSKIYSVYENGDVRNLAPDTTVLQADFQISQLEAKMELFAGAPRESSGFRSPGEKTKFEVQQLASAADKVFEHKMHEFERSFLEPLLKAELEVSRRNLSPTDVQTAELVDETTGAVDFLEITAEDLNAKGQLVPMGARHFSRKSRLTQDLTAFSNTALADPEVRQHFSSEKLARLWEETLDFNQFELVEPYVRVSEQLEMQRLSQVATEQLQNETLAGAEEDIEAAEGF